MGEDGSRGTLLLPQAPNTRRVKPTAHGCRSSSMPEAPDPPPLTPNV